MDLQPAPTRSVPPGRVSGASMVAFGGAVIAASVIATICFGGLRIDLLSFVAIYLGLRVRAGSRRAAGWGMLVMGAYLLSAGMLLVFGLAGPRLVPSTGGGSLPGWALPVSIVVIAWCGATLAM